MRNTIKILVACSLVAGLLVSCKSVDPQVINSSNPNVDYNPVKLVDKTQSSKTVVLNVPRLGISNGSTDSENASDAEDSAGKETESIAGPSKNQAPKGTAGSEADSTGKNAADSKGDTKSSDSGSAVAGPSANTAPKSNADSSKSSAGTSARDKTLAQAEKYIDEGKYPQAITLLNGLLKTNPDDEEAKALLEEAQSKKATADAEAAEKTRQDKLDQARKNIDDGKYTQAISILNGLLKADPDDEEAKALLEEAKSKQAADADEAAAKARQQKLDQAQKYIDEGKYTQANAILNGLLKSDPDDEDAKALQKEIEEKKKADADSKSSGTTSSTTKPSTSTAAKTSTTTSTPSKNTASTASSATDAAEKARQQKLDQARKYIDDGKYTQAISLMNGLLKTNPNDADAKALLKEAQDKKAAADAAAAEKARQQKLDQARKAIDEGKYPQAITTLNALLKADPNDAEAKALLEEAQSKKAAADAAAAEKARQQKLDQARKAIDEGKYAQAITTLNGLLKTDPNDKEANALLKEAKDKQAAANSASKTASSSTSKPSTSTAAKTSTTTSTPSKNTASTASSTTDAAAKARQQKLDQARKYIDDGKYAQAITLLNGLLKTDPNDADAKALLKEAQDKKAAADAAAAEKARQDKLNQARNYIDTEKYPQAITLLNGLLKTNPDDEDAKALLKEAQSKKAAADAAAAEKARQQKLDQARKAIDDGKYAQAITTLNGLLKTDPNDKEANALLKEAKDKQAAANSASKTASSSTSKPSTSTAAKTSTTTSTPSKNTASTASSTTDAAAKARQQKLDQARKYIDDGKYAQAITVLNGLLKTDPNDADAKALLKEAQDKKAAADAAAAEKARQQKLDQARNYIDTGKYAQATTILNGLLKTDPNDEEAKSLLKEIEAKKKAAEDAAAKAKSEADAKAAQAKKDADAKAAQAKKDAEANAAQAKKDAEDKAAKDAADARAKAVAEARSLIDQGKYAQAITLLNSLLKTYPNDTEIKNLLNEAQKKKAAADANSEVDARQKRIDQAKAYIAEKKYANATNILNALLKADPNDKEAQALLDQIKELQKKEEQEAIDEAARARDQKLQQAKEYMEQGKYSLAISTLNGILKNNPDDKEAKDLLAQIQKLQDKAAEEAAAKARQQRLDQARTFIDSKKYTNAINVLNGLLKTNPNDAEAKALLEEAQNKKKIEDEETAAKARQDKLNQAKANIDAGKYSAAITTLNGLLKTNPNDAEAKALLKEAQDKQSAANAEAAEKARKQKLDQAKANIEAGKYSAAISTLNGLLKTDPNDAEAKALLKEAQDKQNAANAEAAEKARKQKLDQAKSNIDSGKYASAISILNGLIKSNPNDAEAKALLKEAEDKKAQEAAEAKKKAEEESAKKAQAQAEAKKKADEAAAKKAQEAAEKKKQAEEAAAAKKAQEAEAKKKAEEDAAKKKQEAEAKKKAEEEAVKKAQAEADAKKKAEEDAAKKEEAKRKTEEEAEKKAQAAAEAKKKAEEAAEKKAQEDAEAKKKAEEEAARLAAQKAADLDKLQRFTTDWESPMLSDIEDCGYFYTSPEFGQFDMIEGEFSKKSGYTKSAYGFVFGYTKPSPRGQLYNYIRFEINTDGEYALYKWDGKTYTDLVEPNSEGTAYFYKSSAINEGYNATNKLKIQVVNGKYNVYINNHLIKRGIPFIEGGTYGVMGFFSVGQANQEDLPNTPVVVSYRITDAELHRK